jgi:hypothetical protein
MSEEVDLSVSEYQYVIAFLATTIIVITVLFEYGQEKLAKFVSEEMAPIMERLYGELTVMGFIGLIMFAFSKLKVSDGFHLKYIIIIIIF